jgi:hypothetical protein
MQRADPDQRRTAAGSNRDGRVMGSDVLEVPDAVLWQLEQFQSCGPPGCSGQHCQALE